MSPGGAEMVTADAGDPRAGIDRPHVAARAGRSGPAPRAPWRRRRRRARRSTSAIGPLDVLDDDSGHDSSSPMRAGAAYAPSRRKSELWTCDKFLLIIDVVEPADLNLRHLQAVARDRGDAAASAPRRGGEPDPAGDHPGHRQARGGSSACRCSSAGRAAWSRPRRRAILGPARRGGAAADRAARGSRRPQMRAFIALARHGSYAGAASETGLREASLHRAVADLSVGLGQQAGRAARRGVALTAARQAIARALPPRRGRASRPALDELAALAGPRGRADRDRRDAAVARAAASHRGRRLPPRHPAGRRSRSPKARMPNWSGRCATARST